MDAAKQIIFFCPGFAGRFSLTPFMAAQSAGLYYDFTKTDRLFQESTGPTPAATVGDAIGLALDQRQWSGQTLAQVVAAQSELVTNGTFNTDLTGWTSGDTGAGAVSAWDAGSGNGRLALPRIDGSNLANRYQAITTVAGRIYCVTARAISAAGQIFAGTTTTGTSLLAVSLLTAGATTSYYFVATGTTSYINFRANANGTTSYIDDVSVKLIPGIPAIQATAGLKPTFQTTGAKFDGSDDNHLTSYLAGAGPNFIVIRATIPATLAATQVLAGASGSGANRFFLGVNTSGNVCGGVGSDSVTTIVGTSDVRGAEIVAGISCDGSSVRLFAGSALEYQAAQNSTPTTTIPFRIGSLNSNGTSASPAAAAQNKLLAGREFLTLSRYTQIRTALLAA